METVKYWVYRFVRFCFKVCYPKITLEGTQNLPQAPYIMVGNHCQLNGPIVAEIYIPGDRAIWCASDMMTLKTIPGYARKDFWFDKPKWSQGLLNLVGYLLAPIAVCLFTKSNCIPVYHDQRVLTTLKKSVTQLKNGGSLVIFPEHDQPYDHILQHFQEGFVDVARLYYRQTGKTISFVPMYLAPKLKKLYFLEPIEFDPEAPIEEERRRLTQALMAAISRKARSLPRHKVICYRKNLNTYNVEEMPHEKAGG